MGSRDAIRRLGSRLSNPEDLEWWLDQYGEKFALEVEDSAYRALDAGAEPPLTFLGMGASGAVFCDAAGIAAKVYRWYRSPVLYAHKEAEAEFLRDAARSAVRDSVARFYGFDPELEVLFRECVEGSPGGWGTRGLSELHVRISKEMEKLGWGSPEYKEDSYVVESYHGRPTGRVVLVDAGSPARLGSNLVRYVEDVIAGRRRHPESANDLGFYLRREVFEGAVERKTANRLIRALGLGREALVRD